MERVDAGVRNPRDLWSAPAVAMRVTGPLGSSMDSIRESQRKPTPRYTGVLLRADALVTSAFQESAGEANQLQQQQQLSKDFPPKTLCVGVEDVVSVLLKDKLVWLTIAIVRVEGFQQKAGNVIAGYAQLLRVVNEVCNLLDSSSGLRMGT